MYLLFSPILIPFWWHSQSSCGYTCNNSKCSDGRSATLIDCDIYNTVNGYSSTQKRKRSPKILLQRRQKDSMQLQFDPLSFPALTHTHMHACTYTRLDGLPKMHKWGNFVHTPKQDQMQLSLSLSLFLLLLRFMLNRAFHILSFLVKKNLRTTLNYF